MNERYTWVQTHKDLANYLSEKKENQTELVDLLEESGVTAGLVDEYPEGKRIRLEEIDPFSFFCFIHKYGNKRRLQILQNLAKKLDLHYPEDVFGIPSSQPLQVMMFWFKYDRADDAIDNLWEFFFSALDNSITDDQFDSLLSQPGVGKVNITEVLFYVNPEKYFPVNGPSKPYLENVLGINPTFENYSGYENILSKIRENSDKEFFELSYEARLWFDEQNKIDFEAWDSLIQKYKSFRSEFDDYDEIYKWEAIKHFQDTFDLDADDFSSNFQDAISKQINLLYQNSRGFILKAVEYFPEEVRRMFENLYDEGQPLEDRIEKFINQSEELEPRVSKEYGKDLSHQQDERTISFYLAMMYPERYPIYKNGIYQYLVSEVTEEDSRSAGEKYYHYRKIGERLLPTIEQDEELLEIVTKDLNNECYQGDQKWLIFQDVLWTNKNQINTSKETNYWVIQGNQKVYDFVGALKDGALTELPVRSHIEKIKAGDKFIFWVTGNRSGCYALGEIPSEIYEADDDEIQKKYYTYDRPNEVSKRVEIEITHNLSESPITKEQIDNVDELSDLNVGLQGTNFSATKQEYEAIERLTDRTLEEKWTRLQKTVQKIGDEKGIRKFFELVKKIIKELNINENDQRLYAAAVDYYLHLTIGSKYVTYIQKKKGKKELAIHVVEDSLAELKQKYPGLEISEGFKEEKIDTKFVKAHPDIIKIEDFIDAGVEMGELLLDKYSKSSYRATFPDVYNPWVIRVALDDKLLELLMNGGSPAFNDTRKPTKKMDFPLNTIFYGPPGTGKTYNTVLRAAEIVEQRKIESYEEAQEVFNGQLGDKIEFITFHQNYSYEDFIQGLRPDTEHNNELTFEKVDGIFKELADKALKNLKSSKNPQTKKKSFEKVFNEYIDPLVQGEVEDIEVKMKRVSFYITAVTNRSIEFRKASGGTAHTLSINTLRKMYEAESILEIQGLNSYYQPLLNKLLDLGKFPEETEIIERKNFVIIIDEINRANISRVFGELITLIEPDKRSEGEFSLSTKLPSGDKFTVPSNLYIIGTMNTADKSIALLDIPLRRRFEFEAMYPKYEINGEIIYDVDVLKKINERMIKLKGHDFQIGHSYFMDSELSLDQRMNRKVIPLLLEYFMNDENEVRGILTFAGLQIKENSWPLQVKGEID